MLFTNCYSNLNLYPRFTPTQKIVIFLGQLSLKILVIGLWWWVNYGEYNERRFSTTTSYQKPRRKCGFNSISGKRIDCQRKKRNKHVLFTILLNLNATIVKSTFFLIPTFNLTYCAENPDFQHSNFQRPESLQLSIVQMNYKI